MYVKTWCTFVDSPLAFIKVISLKQLYADSKYISLGSFLFHFQPPRGKTDALTSGDIFFYVCLLDALN